jgi:hypothetical protein
MSFSSIDFVRWTKNRENNPMQSRVDPGSQHSCYPASGPRDEKRPQPDPIPLYWGGADIRSISADDRSSSLVIPKQNWIGSVCAVRAKDARHFAWRKK